MAYGIKIVEENVSISLSDILNNIDGRNYIWSIFYLEARGDLGAGESILDLEEKISKSKTGLKIAWSSLISLAKKLDQVIDVVIVGNTDSSETCRFGNDEDMYANFDVVIEMIDSSYWLIHAQEEPLITKLSNLCKVEPA